MCQREKGEREEKRIIIRRNGAKTISLTEKICQCCFHESYGKVEISYINVDNF
jgi:hypothetical protein